MMERPMAGSKKRKEAPMDRALLDLTLKAFLKEARVRLDEIVGIARAAEICAEIGQTDKAVRLSLGIEPFLYEVRNFVNTASMINRLWSR
jgi:hypothetical protein